MSSGEKRNGSGSRIGRPPLPVDRRLSQLCAVKLTPAEIEALHSYARRKNTTASEFLRRVVHELVSSDLR